jgi:hypothetical protein
MFSSQNTANIEANVSLVVPGAVRESSEAAEETNSVCRRCVTGSLLGILALAFLYLLVFTGMSLAIV